MNEESGTHELLDIEMPGMNGMETFKELRALEVHFRKQPLLFDGKFSRIIMQTAFEDPKDLFDSYLQGKCNGYITKPFRTDDLMDKIFKSSSNSIL